MARYTTTIRTICESLNELTEPEGYSNVSAVIEKARPLIFDFDFPIYDETYRAVLETKILRHYYMREIGLETVGLWKFCLETKLNEIMPFFNQLYQSATLDFNPFYTVDYFKTSTMTRDSEANGTGTSHINSTDKTDHDNLTASTSESNTTGTSESTTTNDLTDATTTKTLVSSDSTNKQTTVGKVTNDKDHKDAYSDTPQDSVTDVERLAYLTNFRAIEEDDTTTTNTTVTNTDKGSVDTGGTSDTTHTGTVTNSGQTGDNQKSNISTTDSGTTTNAGESTGATTTTNKVNGTDDYIEHVAGKMDGASYASLLLEYRKTLLNIDMEIINSLGELFLNIY